MHRLTPALLALCLSACGDDPDGASSMKRMSPELADTLLGLRDGALSPCPDMPNCVCSQQVEDPDHAIAPLAFMGTPDEAWQALVTLLQDTDRVEILTNERPYLHARFTTRVMRFEDDVEFLLDAPGHVIHVRSASRLGYSDLGKNRSRVEELRKRFGA